MALAIARSKERQARFVEPEQNSRKHRRRIGGGVPPLQQSLPVARLRGCNQRCRESRLHDPETPLRIPRQLARQFNILQCASEMPSEIGYAGTTMRALADKAEVASATLQSLLQQGPVGGGGADLFEELAEEVAATGVAEGVEFLVESTRAKSLSE